MSSSASPGNPAPIPVAGADDARRQRMRVAMRSFGMLPVLIVLGILIQLACIHFTGQGRFLTAQNLSIMAQQASINTVLAAGMTFVILTGGIDLSVGSILAAATMVGMIVFKEAGLIGVPAAMLTGLLFGVINGALIAYIRLPPLIVTLGSLAAVRGFARLVGNDLTAFDPQLSFAFVGNSSLTIIPGVVSIPCLALIAFLVVVISWLIPRRTVLGTHIYAVGGNESAARLAGVTSRGCSCSSTARPACSPASEGSCRRRGSTPRTACSLASPTSLTRSPPLSWAGRASSAASAASGAR